MMLSVPEESHTAVKTGSAGLHVRLAKTDADIFAAQRLRYEVFARELGANGAMVNHAERTEQDRFDAVADHLLLIDQKRAAGDQVVGTYRLMTNALAARAGGFYCADEYDLQPLTVSGLSLLELGRSCLHPDYRGGAGMLHLWGGLAQYIDANSIDVMFGVASFHGTDLSKLRQPLSLLAHRHLAPDHLRVSAHGSGAVPLEMVAPDALDRVTAVRQMPALIKAYLRLGGTVGDGAFVDHAFNTTDICLILERSAMKALQKKIYSRQVTP